MSSVQNASHPSVLRAPRKAIALVFTVVLAASIAPASARSSVTQRILSDCHREGITRSASFATMIADPAAYQNHTVLLGGQLKGVVHLGDQTTYMLGMPDGGEAQFSSTAKVLCRPGDRMCALVKVPIGWRGDSDLALLEAASGNDADSILSKLSIDSHPATPSPRSGTRQGRRSTYVQYQAPSRSFGSMPSGARRRVLDAYASAVRWFNPGMTEQEARTISGHIIWYSQAEGIDARLIVAIIGVESEFHSNATSHKGAMGLGQLMPGTARDLGVQNAYDPEQNIAAAARLIRWHLQQNANTPDPLGLALACYNAGENAVKRYHGIPPYAETQHYVQKVEELYSQLCRGDSH